MKPLERKYVELNRDKSGELVIMLKNRKVEGDEITVQELANVPFYDKAQAQMLVQVHIPIIDQIVISRKEANHADEFLKLFPQEALITIEHMPIGVVLHLTYPRKDVPVASIHQLRRSLARRTVGSLDI